jgi:hypothetical protein
LLAAASSTKRHRSPIIQRLPNLPHRYNRHPLEGSLLAGSIKFVGYGLEISKAFSAFPRTNAISRNFLNQ